jgi:hypothetical protein
MSYRTAISVISDSTLHWPQQGLIMRTTIPDLTLFSPDFVITF